MAFDRVVAVDENNELPQLVRDTLLGSTDFSEAIEGEVSDEASATNAAIRALQLQQLEANEPASDSVMAQVRYDIATDGEESNSTIRALIHSLATPMSFIVPANDFNIQTATPALGVFPGGYPAAWAMDSAAIEEVSAFINPVPRGWGAYSVFVLWTPSTTAAGDVRWRLIASEPAANLPPTQNSFNGEAVMAAGGTVGNMRETEVITNRERVNSPLVLRLARLGNHAADTYAADVSFMGLQFVRTG